MNNKANKMTCEVPSKSYTKYLVIAVIWICSFVVADYIHHYNEYSDLQFCKETFKSGCKLIAVPTSVKDIVNDTP